VDRIADELNNIFTDCLFRDGEPHVGAIIVDGIRAKHGLHAGRTESHRNEIVAIIAEMDPSFKAANGGGATFLNLCMDKNGNQWGEHVNCEQLVVLAIALKLGNYSTSHREMWKVMPGGMPYVYFK
jgi:site-specific recombinase